MSCIILRPLPLTYFPLVLPTSLPLLPLVIIFSFFYFYFWVTGYYSLQQKIYFVLENEHAHDVPLVLITALSCMSMALFGARDVQCRKSQNIRFVDYCNIKIHLMNIYF